MYFREHIEQMRRDNARFKNSLRMEGDPEKIDDYGDCPDCGAFLDNPDDCPCGWTNEEEST